MPKLHIRWMLRTDLPQVLSIEQKSFGHPWSEEEFRQNLRKREAIGMVAETKDEKGASKILGYVCYEIHSNHISLTNLAVDPEYRRQGVGSEIVDKMVQKLESHRRQKLTAAIGEKNLDAQLFFRDHDFKATRVAKSYYQDTGEDAFVMERYHSRLNTDEILADISYVNRIKNYSDPGAGDKRGNAR